MNPKEKSFVDIVAALKDYYEPKPLITVERFHFHRRNQASGESIAAYVAELRLLASKCEFGAYLKEALHDRLVCGLLSEVIQRALLSEVDLTLKRVVEIAQGMKAQKCSIFDENWTSRFVMEDHAVVAASNPLVISFENRGAITVVAWCICQIVTDLRRPPATHVARRATLRWYVGLLREIHKVALEKALTMWTPSSHSRTRLQMIPNSFIRSAHHHPHHMRWFWR